MWGMHDFTLKRALSPNCKRIYKHHYFRHVCIVFCSFLGGFTMILKTNLQKSTSNRAIRDMNVWLVALWSTKIFLQQNAFNLKKRLKFCVIRLSRSCKIAVLTNIWKWSPFKDAKGIIIPGLSLLQNMDNFLSQISLFRGSCHLQPLDTDARSFAFQVLYDNLEAKNAENENKIKELSKELRKKTNLVEVCA